MKNKYNKKDKIEYEYRVKDLVEALKTLGVKGIIISGDARFNKSYTIG